MLVSETIAKIRRAASGRLLTAQGVWGIGRKGDRSPIAAVRRPIERAIAGAIEAVRRAIEARLKARVASTSTMSARSAWQRAETGGVWSLDGLPRFEIIGADHGRIGRNTEREGVDHPHDRPGLLARIGTPNRWFGIAQPELVKAPTEFAFDGLDNLALKRPQRADAL
jgi:hypothetical protein